jgi:hypothetical protein
MAVSRKTTRPKVIEVVRDIVSRCPDAKRNNNLLAVLFWQYGDGIKINPTVANEIATATSVESIARARRELTEYENKRRAKNTEVVVKCKR